MFHGIAHEPIQPDPSILNDIDLKCDKCLRMLPVDNRIGYLLVSDEYMSAVSAYCESEHVLVCPICLLSEMLKAFKAQTEGKR